MAGKIKGCTHYPTKLVTKAATGGIMTVPQQPTNPGVEPYKMPAPAANTQAQQRAQLAKDNYASIASQYMSKAAARRAAPAAAAAPAYQKTDIEALKAKYGLNPPPAPAARAAAQPAGQAQREGPPQGSAASRNTKWDTYNSPADTKARAMSYGPQPKPKGFTGLRDMVNGGGPGQSRASAAAAAKSAAKPAAKPAASKPAASKTSPSKSNGGAKASSRSGGRY